MILTATVACGIFKASERDMILYPLQKLATRMGKLGYPVANCTACMAGSIWGLITMSLWVWWSGTPVTIELVPHVLINNLGAAFLAPALYSFFGLADEDQTEPTDEQIDAQVNAYLDEYMETGGEGYEHATIDNDCHGMGCRENEEV